MVLGSLLDDIEIVVVHALRVVMVTAWDDVSYISCLYSIVAIVVHQLEGLLDMSLIVLGRAGCLVVHQQPDTLGVGIVVQHLDVEVGIGSHEVKDITLPHVGPVFPAYIPAFDEYLVESVLGGEVDVALHVLVVGLMRAVGLHLAPVNLVELDAGEVIGIVPIATTYNHLPPDATILRRMNPRGILELAGLVEVEYQVA